jgi:hypothetical protein
MLQCECDYGFDCTYTKAIRGKVVLPVDPEVFDDSMQQSLIQAIADSAGVSPDRVRIISVERVPGVSTRSSHKGKTRKAHKTLVQIRVMGATSLRKVEKFMRQHGLPPAKFRTRMSWDHHVEVKPWPRKKVSGGWI